MTENKKVCCPLCNSTMRESLVLPETYLCQNNTCVLWYKNISKVDISRFCSKLDQLKQEARKEERKRVYDEEGILHGEDAKRFVENLGKPNPARDKIVEKAQKIFASVKNENIEEIRHKAKLEVFDAIERISTPYKSGYLKGCKRYFITHFEKIKKEQVSLTKEKYKRV
jgi:hypothetical protein